MKRQRGRGRRPGGGGHQGGGGGHHGGGHNNPNRPMESNGPDMKVRGPASHIYERYLQLSRDAASSGDRVLSENYAQHADHYFRLMRSMQPAQPPQQPQQERFNNNNNEGEFEGGEEGGERAIHTRRSLPAGGRIPRSPFRCPPKTQENRHRAPHTRRNRRVNIGCPAFSTGPPGARCRRKLRTLARRRPPTTTKPALARPLS